MAQFRKPEIPASARRQSCSPRILLAAAIGLLSLQDASAAFAQQVDSGASLLSPSAQVATPPAPAPPPPVQSLLVNPLGIRTWLTDHGISLILDTWNEFAGNVSGGTRQAASNSGQVGYEADIDWQKLAGVTGFSTHVVVVSRYGNNLSANFGDNLEPVQQIYGSGGNVVAHLVYAYGEETLANDRVTFEAGRIPVSNDFASSPLYCEFMGNGLCGNPKATTDLNGFSSYPDAGWAGEVRVRPINDIYVQTGIFAYNSGLYKNRYFRSGFKFDSSQITGEMFPVELGWEPSFGPDKLAGHYKLGYGYDNAPHPDDYFDIDGSALAETGLAARTNHGHSMAWALVDQMFVRNGSGGNAGLIGLAGFTHNNPQSSTRAEQYYLGLEDNGFWHKRPLDNAGALFTYNTVSGALGKTEALDLEFGLPLPAQAGGIQTHEEVLELFYNIHVYRGIDFAPDFQYIIRPNAVGNIPNAAVLGFNSHIVFF